MILQSKNILSYLYLLLPLFLITGPAIPDIIITLGGLFAIFYIVYQKEYENFIKLNLFRISIIFWLSLILISFFAYQEFKSRNKIKLANKFNKIVTSFENGQKNVNDELTSNTKKLNHRINAILLEKKQLKTQFDLTFEQLQDKQNRKLSFQFQKLYWI